MVKLSKSGTNEFVIDLWLLILRVAVGASMLTHGIPKLQTLFAGGEIQFPDPFGIGATLTLVLVVFAEGLCSALLILGMLTRLASIPLVINMIVVFFCDPWSRPFRGEGTGLVLFAVLFDFSCIWRR
ncbi:MAG: DoxX family protein [Mangrovibacterium sp.]